MWEPIARATASARSSRAADADSDGDWRCYDGRGGRFAVAQRAGPDGGGTAATRFEPDGGRAGLLVMCTDAEVKTISDYLTLERVGER